MPKYHLIPAFDDLRTSRLLSATPGAGYPPGDTDDWEAVYVNWFVDRDMVMRYVGGGVGHTHQNRTVGRHDTMDVDIAARTTDGETEMPMDVASDDEEGDEANWYQSGDEDEDEENGDSEEDSDDDALGPEDGELDVAMSCDYDFL
ncbi:hypothetical protein HWV62_30919 [Athelia sp. TMB]|nr:hypothetical protein HWV62_30919 [Athelia sp. TMB]